MRAEFLFTLTAVVSVKQCLKYFIEKNHKIRFNLGEIPTLKYSLACYAELTSFRTVNGGLVIRSIRMPLSQIHDGLY